MYSELTKNRHFQDFVWRSIRNLTLGCMGQIFALAHNQMLFPLCYKN